MAAAYELNNSTNTLQIHMTERVPTTVASDIDTLHYIGHGFIVPSICALGILCNGVVIMVLLKKSLSQVHSLCLLPSIKAELTIPVNFVHPK